MSEIGIACPGPVSEECSGFTTLGDRVLSSYNNDVLLGGARDGGMDDLLGGTGGDKLRAEILASPPLDLERDGLPGELVNSEA